MECECAAGECIHEIEIGVADMWVKECLGEDSSLFCMK